MSSKYIQQLCIISFLICIVLLNACRNDLNSAGKGSVVNSELPSTENEDPKVTTQKIISDPENAFVINIKSGVLSARYDSTQLDSVALTELEKIIIELQGEYTFSINATNDSQEMFLSVSELLSRCNIKSFKIDID